ANPTLTASYDGFKGTDDATVVSGLTITTPAVEASDVGGYAITLSECTATNYNITRNDGTLSVTEAQLTITGIIAENKVYDGTAEATLNTDAAALVGVLGADEVNLIKTGATGAFEHKNVGSNKTVFITGLAIEGADRGNYSLTQVTTTADITAKELTVTGVTAENKIYDGTTDATLNNDTAALDGVLGADEVNLIKTGATGTFEDENIGSNKTVFITGLAIEGADGGNYSLTQPQTTADITLAAANYLRFMMQPAHSAVGEAISPAVTVGVFDSNGNLCTHDSATLVNISTYTNPGSGTLSGDFDKKVENGVATFDNLSIDAEGVGYTLKATTGDLVSTISDSFNVGVALWTGSASTNWDTDTNWDIGTVPSSSYSVVVPSVANTPVLAGSVTIVNLTVESEGVLSTNNNPLIATGNVTLRGTLNTGSSRLIVSGDWTNSGVFNASTSTVEFDGSTAQIISAGGTGEGQGFWDVTISNASGTVSLSENPLRIANDLRVDEGAIFDVSGQAVTVGNNLTNSGKITTSSGNIDLDVIGTLTLSAIAINSIETYGGDVDLTGCPAIVLGADTVIDADADNGGDIGDIIFAAAGTITGAHTLRLNGDTVTLCQIGVIYTGTSNPTGLAVTGDTQTRLYRDIVVDGDIMFNGAIVLYDNVIIDTTGKDGNIEFNGTLDADGTAPRNLVVDAQRGNIGFNYAVGSGYHLNDLMIWSGDDVNYSSTVTLDGNLSQFVTYGSTTYDGAVNAGGYIFVGALENYINASMSADGFVLLEDVPTGMHIFGDIFLGGSLTTDSGALAFDGPVVLTAADVVLNTANNNSDGEKVTFESTLDADGEVPRNLYIEAQKGNIDFNGAIGDSCPLNDLTVWGGNDVHYSSTVTLDGKLEQNVSYGRTTYDGAVNAGGDIAICALENYINAPMAARSIWILGDEAYLGANLTTGGGAINFGYADTDDEFPVAVVLTADDVLLDTTNAGAAADGADITFNGTLDSDSAASPRNLWLDAQRGDIDFNGIIGGTSPLNDLTIWGGKDVHYTGAVTLDGNLSQFVTYGSTTYDGAVNVGGYIFVGALENYINAPLRADGFVLIDDVPTGMHIFGDVFLGSSLTTNSGAIAFDGPVVLTAADVVLNTANNNSDGEKVIFGSTLDADGEAPRNLWIEAQKGNIDFNGAIGGICPLNDLTVWGGNDVHYSSTVTLDGKLEQNVSYGCTIYDGAVNAGGYIAICALKNYINAPMAARSIWVLGDEAYLGANLTTDNGAINFGHPEFSVAVILTADVLLDTTNAGAATDGADITFNGTLDSDSTARDLTLSAGAGKIDFKEAIGSTDPLGDLKVTSGTTTFADGSTVDINGSVTIVNGVTFSAGSSFWKVARNWINRGTFNGGNSTVEFDGTAQFDITGANTFYNLLIDATTDGAKTVRFGAGDMQTITNTLTLTGAPGKLLTIRSTSPGTAAILEIPASIGSGVEYVDVQDNAISGGNEVTAALSINSGGNTNWLISGASAYLAITGNASMTAGGTNELTITAYDADGNIATSYTGLKGLIFSGLSNAPNGTPPTVENTIFTSSTPITFAGGVSNVGMATLKAYCAETANLYVADDDDATINSTGHDLVLSVDPAPLDHFVWLEIPEQRAGTAFTATITARDEFDNTTTRDAYGNAFGMGENVMFSTDATPSPGDDWPTCDGVELTADGVMVYVDSIDEGTFRTKDIVLYNAAETPRLAMTLDGRVGMSDEIEVNPRELNHFTWAEIPPQVVGVPFKAEITARDKYGNLTTIDVNDQPFADDEIKMVTFSTTAKAIEPEPSLPGVDEVIPPQPTYAGNDLTVDTTVDDMVDLTTGVCIVGDFVLQDTLETPKFTITHLGITDEEITGVSNGITVASPVVAQPEERNEAALVQAIRANDVTVKDAIESFRLRDIEIISAFHASEFTAMGETFMDTINVPQSAWFWQAATYDAEADTYTLK
ncbi:YDG domain-containing protein, partial [Candidatus Omnitrophota bacterium]